MTLTLEPILRSGRIDPAEALVIRHAFVKEHEDAGLPGIHADSTELSSGRGDRGAAAARRAPARLITRRLRCCAGPPQELPRLLTRE